MTGAKRPERQSPLQTLAASTTRNPSGSASVMPCSAQ
jgi:hypothetical protein